LIAAASKCQRSRRGCDYWCDAIPSTRKTVGILDMPPTAVRCTILVMIATTRPCGLACRARRLFGCKDATVRALTIATWSVLIADAAVVALLVVFSIAGGSAAESATMIAYAILVAVPLVVLVTILGLGARRSRVGLWICLVLGLVPLILLLGLLGS